MICPSCKGQKTEVRDSRIRKDGRIRRRGYCEGCSISFTTVEIEADLINRIVKARVRRVITQAMGLVAKAKDFTT